MERLEYWHTYINKNLSEPIMINDEILRVTLVNQGKSKISAFFTFKTKKQVLEFIKEVILPSITISSFNPNDNVSIYLREHKDMLDIIDIHTDYFNKKISRAYIDSFNDINEISDGRGLTQQDVDTMTKTIESRFDVYNEVYLTLNYAENTSSFLKNFIDEYKKFEGIEILNEKLKENDLSVDRLLDISDNISKNEQGIRSLVLDRLPS